MLVQAKIFYKTTARHNKPYIHLVFVNSHVRETDFLYDEQKKQIITGETELGNKIIASSIVPSLPGFSDKDYDKLVQSLIEGNPIDRVSVDCDQYLSLANESIDGIWNYYIPHVDKNKNVVSLVFQEKPLNLQQFISPGISIREQD